jgi:hypothetical protein
VIISPIGSSSDKPNVFGVRERKFYRLKGQPMRSIYNIIVTKNMEQVAMKVEKLKGSQISGSCEKEKPSKSFKKESWYEMGMQDAQEHEIYKSMFRGSDSL